MKLAKSPLRHALVAQMLGAVLAAGMILGFFPTLLAQPLAMAGIQGLGAALISHLRRGPVWWLPIHLGFMPLAVLMQRLQLPSWIWLAGFAMLLSIFWRTDRSRVPLYLTNALAGEALAGLLPAAPVAMVDLGCGDGGLLRRLARRRPDCRFVGFEHAPLPWAWAWLSCRHLPNVEIRFGDFWSRPLGDYALVYAFLSPAPMQQLWAKARAEMKAGALLVSNSFAVPDIQPASTVEVADSRHTRFYCYRPGPDRTGTYPRDACPQSGVPGVQSTVRVQGHPDINAAIASHFQPSKALSMPNNPRHTDPCCVPGSTRSDAWQTSSALSAIRVVPAKPRFPTCSARAWVCSDSDRFACSPTVAANRWIRPAAATWSPTPDHVKR